MDPKMETPGDSAVEMNELVLPQHTNNLGTAFGGVIMSWIDICGAMVASRHARATVVTASMDQLDFIVAIRAGHMVNLKGMVNAVGRSSMEIGVRVEAEDLISGERFHAASAYLTFVALDPQGHPTPVPGLSLDTQAAQIRSQDADARRSQRLATASQRRANAAAAQAE